MKAIACLKKIFLKKEIRRFKRISHQNTFYFLLMGITLCISVSGKCQEIEANATEVLMRGKDSKGILSVLQDGVLLYDRADPTAWLNGFIINIHNNQTRAFSVMNNWASTNFEIYGDGTAYTKGVVVTSDSTAKEDIRQLDSQLGRIQKVKGVSYKWKEDKESGAKGARRTYGVLAQDLEKIYPDMVFTNDKGEKGVYYDELTVVLLEAVKEQQAEIERQAELLINLETRLKQLEIQLKTKN